jgi:hypothetical protein
MLLPPPGSSLLDPQPLKPGAAPLGVLRRLPDVSVPQVVLNRARVRAPLRQKLPAAVPPISREIKALWTISRGSAPGWNMPPVCLLRTCGDRAARDIVVSLRKQQVVGEVTVGPPECWRTQARSQPFPAHGTSTGTSAVRDGPCAGPLSHRPKGRDFVCGERGLEADFQALRRLARHSPFASVECEWVAEA